MLDVKPNRPGVLFQKSQNSARGTQSSPQKAIRQSFIEGTVLGPYSVPRPLGLYGHRAVKRHHRVNSAIAPKQVSPKPIVHLADIDSVLASQKQREILVLE